MSLFKRTPDKLKIQVIKRDPTRITMDEWRADPEMVKTAMRVLRDPDVRLMLDTLVAAHPANVVLNPPVDLADRAVWQARCEGYTIALANLESLAVFVKPRQHVEPDFLDENQPIE